MTENKPIMIDGVNVSGCEFAVKPINDNRIKCHCAKGLLQLVKMQEQPESIKSGLCENNPDCYFKQLARKTQECEELKKTITNLENIRDEFSTKLDQLKKTLTEIKEIVGKQCVCGVNCVDMKQILQKIREVEDVRN